MGNVLVIDKWPRRPTGDWSPQTLLTTYRYTVIFHNHTRLSTMYVICVSMHLIYWRWIWSGTCHLSFLRWDETRKCPWQDIYVDSIRVRWYASWSCMSRLAIERPCLRLGSSHRLRYSQARDRLWHVKKRYYCVKICCDISDHMRVLHSCVKFGLKMVVGWP